MMRNGVSNLCLIYLVLSCFTLVHAQDKPASLSLNAEVQKIVAEHHGDVALYAEDLRTHRTIAISADTPVQTASVIKLAILYEALEQIRSGKVHFNDHITLTHADQVSGSGVLRLFDAPMSITFKDVLSMMIVLSDNTAANMAMDHLGIENIDRTVARLGLKNTYLYKKVFTPAPPGVVMPDDQKKFGLGKTTAREMATLMTKLTECDLAEPGNPARPEDTALCGVALNMLHLQFYRNAIPRYLDGMAGATGDSIANKTGSLDAVRDDVAAVSTKNGMVIISAFTWNNKDHSWGTEQEAEMTIAKLARAIIQGWSPDGLAPWQAASGKSAQ